MRTRTWSEQGYTKIAEALNAARRVISDDNREILVKYSGGRWYWRVAESKLSEPRPFQSFGLSRD